MILDIIATIFMSFLIAIIIYLDFKGRGERTSLFILASMFLTTIVAIWL